MDSGPGAAKAEPDLRARLQSLLCIALTVDGRTRTITVYDANGARAVRDGDVLGHPSLPGLTLDVRALFDRASR